ncbi:MAG TPA: hypothetical protein PKA55_20895 [Rhodoblastus sp.]|nr:hypothetical protein [Rhodoblastus sp.]
MSTALRRRKVALRASALLSAFFLLASPGSISSALAQESVIFTFFGARGAAPVGPLAVGDDGSLYGTTLGGGANGTTGTVFRLTPPVPPATNWKETVLYSFAAPKDGYNPPGGVIFGPDGALYGTTWFGGSYDSGTIFKLSPPPEGQTAWKETVLHSFQARSAGTIFFASIIFGPDDAIYGTTSNGGASDGGTVFKLAPPTAPATNWNFTTLHAFRGSPDGVYPTGGIIFGPDGALYGTTQRGGSGNGQGMVFKLTPPQTPGANWLINDLYSFSYTGPAGDPCAAPGALALSPGGAIYGRIGGGCSVFRLNPPLSPGAKYTITKFAPNFGNGANDPILFDRHGAIYITIGQQGRTGCGEVLKVLPPVNQPNVFTIYSFAGGPNDGCGPRGGIVFGKDGALYGTTYYGGAKNGLGSGVAYRIQ